MSADAHIDPRVLSAHVDGELGEGEKSRVEAHLETCPDCSRRADELAGVSGLVKQMPRMKAPDELVTRLLSTRHRTWLWPVTGEPRRWVAAGVAAAAVVITLAGPILPPVDADLVRVSGMIRMDWSEPAPAPQATGDQSVRQIVSKDAPSRLAGSYRLAGAYEMEVEGKRAEQWVYTDGSNYLVVLRTKGAFRAPSGFQPAEWEGKRVWSGPHPGMWAWEGDGHSWLLLAEEPAVDPAAVVEPFPEGRPSLWSRLGSAWTRMADALWSLL